MNINNSSIEIIFPVASQKGLMELGFSVWREFVNISKCQNGGFNEDKARFSLLTSGERTKGKRQKYAERHLCIYFLCINVRLCLFMCKN